MKNPSRIQAAHGRDFSEPRSREWIDNEVLRCEFEDVRHRKRLRQLQEQFSDGVGSTTPWTSQDWANTKAAYRFFSNERISEAVIMAGHFGATRERFAGTGKSLALVLHDTMELSYRHEVRWSRLFGQFFRVLKWKPCSVRRRGGGNVKIGFIDFQGLVGRAENSSIVFRAFHETGISTAWMVAR